jgi:hypothetical protein
MLWAKLQQQAVWGPAPLSSQWQTRRFRADEAERWRSGHTISGLGMLLGDCASATSHEALDPWTLTDQAKIDAVLKLEYVPAKRAAWKALNVEIGGSKRD